LALALGDGDDLSGICGPAERAALLMLSIESFPLRETQFPSGFASPAILASTGSLPHEKSCALNFLW
jgi:hypothetical protein